MFAPPRLAIALGSNLPQGDRPPAEILNLAVDRLGQLPTIASLQVSAWHRTAPIGPPQPDYVNGCAIATLQDSATIEPVEFLHQLQAIENEFGRERRERWGARTLDLDLILWGDRQIDTPELTVPHPRWRDRAFVLVPLAEIAPDWEDPETGETVAVLVKKCDASGVRQLESPCK
ncbi:MAG: 2-amino-4-hydroxy-6-hydroxymethyldihydropteridine diphosphokinase [Geitlerinemataceae cyanobacterium]